MKRYLIIPIAIIIFVLTPAMAMAQGPDCTFTVENGTAEWDGNELNWSSGPFSACAGPVHHQRFRADVTGDWEFVSQSGWNNTSYTCFPNQYIVRFNGGRPDFLSPTPITATTVFTDVREIFFLGANPGFSGQLRCVSGSGETEQLCDLVPNADFVDTDDWLLSETASITQGILSLEPTGIAAQNLILSSNSTYNVSIVILDTTVTDLAIVLGVETEIVNVTGSGTYNVSLETVDLFGPVAFGVQNDGPGSVDIDFICLSLASEGGGGEQNACIQPENGDFDTASNWNFYRGAMWSSVSRDVLLPSADNGLAQAASLDLEDITLAAGENLLMSWDARGNGANGVIGAAIGASGNDFAGFFETFPTYYTYEANISDMAGGSFEFLSFVGVITQGLSADIQLDNVCIFVANRDAQLPHQTDPEGITPIDLGFNYTNCGDIDGIWAGFGVNIAQHRANYNAGFSFWDEPLQWLASAVWVLLADWSCMFMAAFVGLVNIIEYAINNGLNYAGWFRRSFADSIVWAGQWGDWLYQSWLNLTEDYGDFAGDWLTWFGDGLEYIGLWSGENGTNFATWIATSIITFAIWLIGFLATGFGLIPVFNALIDLFNALGVDLVSVLASAAFGSRSQAAFDFISSFGPMGEIIALILWLILEYFVLVFDLMLATWQLFVMFMWWLWYNVISVGHIPIYFYYGFDDGINATPYDALVNCADENFWCVFLAGVQLINQVSSHSIFYPIVIVGIILSTIVILWRNITDLFDIYIR